MTRVEVARERLPGWIERYADRHGGLLRRTGSVIEAADGSTATFETFDATAYLVVLVRRGGYAVARVVHGSVAAQTCGTRYVQSRTAAGGWSQQRYQRRRGNQADALVSAVAEKARALLEASGPAVDGVVLGGDRSLANAVRASLPLPPDLLTWEFYDIPDPRSKVLADVVRRSQAVRVTVTDLDPQAPDSGGPA